MDHLNSQELTPKHNNSSLGRKFVLPAIIFLTILGTVVPLYRFTHGYKLFFNGALFLPIVLTCIYYPKKGILYTTCVSVIYVLVLLLFPRYPALLITAIIRVIFFEIVAI